MDKFEKYLADAADTSKTRYDEFSKSIEKEIDTGLKPRHFYLILQGASDKLAVKDYATLLIAESELVIYQNVLEVYRSHMNSKGH